MPLAIFFEKNVNFWQFLTVKWQFSGGSNPEQKYSEKSSGFLAFLDNLAQFVTTSDIRDRQTAVTLAELFSDG